VNHAIRPHVCLSAIVALAAAASARALPAVLTESATDDNTTVTIRILDQVIVGDTNSWCQLELAIVGSVDYPVQADDVVTVWVYEDDTTGDDLVFTETFSPTASEVTAGAAARAFDCTGLFPDDDPGDVIEIYAEAEVNWGCCYWDDQPSTALIDSTKVTDDDAEEDDLRPDANALAPGLTADRIAADIGDWRSFTLDAAAHVDLRVLHTTRAGRVSVLLEDSGGVNVGTVTAIEDETSVAGDLAAGDYLATVYALSLGDPNFYDLELTVGPAGADADADADADAEVVEDVPEDDGGGDVAADADADADAPADLPDEASDDAEAGADAAADVPDDVPADVAADEGGENGDAEGCGCRAAGDASGNAWLVLGLLFLAGRRLVRRRRPSQAIGQ
jgi:MYXO-CTERM domain-containing protein